jgi:nucleoside-diphosphate-sugar epimerase
MSILITGANGAIGFDLVNLLSQYKKIYAVSRNKKRNKKIFNVEWISHDFKNEIKFKIKQPLDCIIHCAVDQNYLNKNNKKYSVSNLKIIKNLINFAKKNRTKIIINFSSIEVYGMIRKKLLNEKYKPFKPNSYGQTKLLIEKYLYKNNVNFINLRLPGILCKFKKNLNRPWLNNILRGLKKNEDITIFNGLNKFNNVIDSNQIAKIILLISEKNFKIRNSYNLASSKPMVLMNLLKRLKKKMRSKSRIINLIDSNKISFYISVRKLEKKLGIKLETTLKIAGNHSKTLN